MAVYLDDGFFDHHKALTAGEDACLLYIQGLAFTSRNDTRGFIPSGALPRLTAKRGASRLAAALVNSGLWLLVEGGWRIHDYEDRNASQIARREKARRASNARWHPEQCSEHAPSIDGPDAPSNAKRCSSNAIPQPQPHKSLVVLETHEVFHNPVDDDGKLLKKAETLLAEREAKLGPVANRQAWLSAAVARLKANPPPPEPRSVVAWFPGCEPNPARSVASD